MASRLRRWAHLGGKREGERNPGAVPLALWCAVRTAVSAVAVLARTLRARGGRPSRPRAPGQAAARFHGASPHRLLELCGVFRWNLYSTTI